MEHRRLLDAAGWFGTLINDADGNLFTVDLQDDVSLEYLGQSDEVMFDVAFAPWGELFGIGGPAEGPSELFTLDVDLNNPGGDITATNLGVISVPGEGPVFLNSLGFRTDGTLFGAGFDQFSQEFVYSIDTLSANATEELSLWPYQAAGDLAFDMDGNMYVTTFGADLLQIDPALTTVAVVGPIGYFDFYGLSYGPDPSLYGFRWLPEAHQINPADATTTPLGALTHDSPPVAGIYGAATVFQPPTDLGVVDYRELADQQPVLGQLWYRLEASHDGYITADLPGAAPGSDIELTLYSEDALGELNQVATGPLRVDYDAAVQGEPYFLQIKGADSAIDVRLTNLVNATADGATVHGTADDDLFEFEAGSPTLITINGVGYAFNFTPAPEAAISFLGGAGDDAALLVGTDQIDAATLESSYGQVTGPGYVVQVYDTVEIAFAGGGGDDSATLTGTGAVDDATVWPNAAELSGPLYRLVATDAPTIDVDAGGGEDTLSIVGSSANEAVELWPDYAEFSGSAFLVRAAAFETVTADAGGGEDDVTLHDSPGDETLIVRPHNVAMYGTGFFLLADGFTNTRAFADQDGFDLVKLHDSPGHDVLRAWPDKAELTGDGFSIEVHSFEETHGYAFSGGFDMALLYDSPGDDHFEADPIEGALSGSYDGGFYNRAKHFEQVHAYARGGYDVADLTDSAGDDTFEGDRIQGALQGQDFYNRAKYFEQVNVHGTEGDDLAELHDYGGHEVLIAYPGYFNFYSDLFQHRVLGFNRMDAYADFGEGLDVAKLFDGPGDDFFLAYPDYAKLEGEGFQHRTFYFDEVHAYATAGGSDLAKLLDSPNNETFEANPTYGALHGVAPHGRFYNRAKYFEQTHAYSLYGGIDVAILTGSDGDDFLEATTTQAALFDDVGGTFYNRAKHFRQVYADAGGGGANDRADLYGSMNDDLLTGLDDWIRLADVPESFLNQATGFHQVWAYPVPKGEIQPLGAHDGEGVDESAVDYILHLDGVWEEL